MIRSTRSILVIALGLMIAFMVMVPVAQAEDIRIDATVDSVTVSTDKNGNQYVRIIIIEARDLDGIEYKAGTPVMFFGENVETGKQLQKGDKISAIVNKQMYRGSPSYTIRKVIG